MIFCPTPLTGTAGSPSTAYLWAWDVITGGNGVDQCAIGIAPASYAGLNVRPHYSTAAAAFLTENGFYFCNGSSSTSVFVFTSGDRIFGYWDGKGGLAFGKVIGGTRYWNGSYTDANIAAGTGLFNVETGGSPLSGPFAIFVSMTGAATDSFAILSTSTADPVVGGGGYLPSTGVVAITSFQATDRIACSVGWTATGIGGIGGLNCISNGTTTVLGGTTTGTIGVALGPAFSAGSVQSIQIQDSTYTLDTTPPTQNIVVFPSHPETKEAINVSCTSVNGTPHVSVNGLPYPSTSGTIDGGPYNTIYLDTAVVWYHAGVGDVTPSVSILDSGSGTLVAPAQIIEIDNQFGYTIGTSTYTILYGGYTGTVPTTGSGTLSGDGTLALSSGYYDASDFTAGQVHGSATVTATVGAATGTWTYSSVYLKSFVEDVFARWHIEGGATFGATTVAFIVYVAATETLTLTSASYALGTTTLVGTDLYGTLTAADWSLDNGAYGPVSSLNVIGTDYTATSLGSLALGSHTAQIMNHISGVQSNVVTFIVSAETITLLSAGGALGGTLSVSGTTDYGPPSGQDFCLDGTWGGSLSPYSNTGTGITDVPFAGSGAASLSLGTHTAQTRDTARPSVTSNILTFSVLSAPKAFLSINFVGQ